MPMVVWHFIAAVERSLNNSFSNSSKTCKVFNFQADCRKLTVVVMVCGLLSSVGVEVKAGER